MRLAVALLILAAAPATAAPPPRPPMPDPLGRGYLGIYFTDGGGLGIQRVEPNTPASRAGLMPGDVFLRVGGVEPKERTHMQQVLVSLRPGSRVLITVRRGDEEKTVLVQLGSRPTDLEYIPPPPPIDPP
jgi:S1-C subfamily serine protease